MSKWNGRTIMGDALALKDAISAEGCWCLRCMADNASNGDGSELVAWIGFDPKAIDCQGEQPESVAVLVRIAMLESSQPGTGG